MNIVPKTYLLAAVLSLALAGCDSIWTVNGSFEESSLSGRIHAPMDKDNATRRYFRLHLRQFDDTIGGTFESFDLDSMEAFARVPEFMEQSMNRYYCSRIDYGYVRDGVAYISLTDREQRHWTMTLNLGDKTLHGGLARTDIHRIEMPSDDFLMPEDKAYLRDAEESHHAGNMQIAFEDMGRLGDRALDCVYYFKSREIDFILPAALNLNTLCHPSPQECRNLRLAIIGIQTQPHIIQNDLPPLQEVMSAYLDSCDVDENRIRTINLRENPHVFTSHSEGFFVATAIIYDDFNADKTWDKADEPIYAMLDSQSLVFYDRKPESDVYGFAPDRSVYDKPVIELSNMTEFPGWQAYHDSSENVDNNVYIRVLKRLTPNPSKYLYFKSINIPGNAQTEPGCYIHPNSPNQQECQRLLPILLQ